MKKRAAFTVAGFAVSALLAQVVSATPVVVKPADFAVPQGGISVTAPALYEGLARTTPPDLSEFASRQPKLRNESLPQDLRNRNEVKKEEKRAN